MSRARRRSSSSSTPTGRPRELKGALTGSAKGGTYTPFQQGSGRIQVDKAIRQTVIAEPASVSFGIQQWPHTDDKPVTRQLTYRNLGDDGRHAEADVDRAPNPKGQAAPAGFFKLGATTVTVPAGGRASVGPHRRHPAGRHRSTAPTRRTWRRRAAAQTVRTAAAVQREVESYDVTLKFLDRHGQAGRRLHRRSGRHDRSRRRPVVTSPTTPTAPSPSGCPRAVTSWTPASSSAPTRRSSRAPTGWPSRS